MRAHGAVGPRTAALVEARPPLWRRSSQSSCELGNAAFRTLVSSRISRAGLTTGETVCFMPHGMRAQERQQAAHLVSLFIIGGVHVMPRQIDHHVLGRRRRPGARARIARPGAACKPRIIRSACPRSICAVSAVPARAASAQVDTVGRKPLRLRAPKVGCGARRGRAASDARPRLPGAAWPNSSGASRILSPPACLEPVRRLSNDVAPRAQGRHFEPPIAFH